MMKQNLWTKGLTAAMLVCLSAAASAPMPPDLKAKIDAASEDALEKTGVPSATVGVVLGGHTVMTSAYGNDRLKPDLKATASKKRRKGLAVHLARL